MDPIVLRSLVIDRARQAVESGQPIHRVQPWPVGTAAGHLFQREVQHLQFLREAAERASKEIRSHISRQPAEMCE